jgi:ankyrin repeat protein
LEVQRFAEDIKEIAALEKEKENHLKRARRKRELTQLIQQSMKDGNQQKIQQLKRQIGKQRDNVFDIKELFILYAIDDEISKVRFLLEMGIDVDSVDEDKNTALIRILLEKPHIIKHRLLEMIRLFIQMRANINAKNKSGDTALMVAIDENHDIEIINELLKHYPDINIQNNDRQTALMLAVQNNNIEIIKELLKRNPDITLKDKNGFTAQSDKRYNRSKQYKQVIALLFQEFKSKKD